MLSISRPLTFCLAVGACLLLALGKHCHYPPTLPLLPAPLLPLLLLPLLQTSSSWQTSF
jgi:hypothetical protein